jgi:predicted ATPase/DNA-binding XRE family transcriptional regulator
MQKELALQIGCSPETLRKIEAGALRPSTQLAELLCEPLEIEPAHCQALVQFARSRQQEVPGVLLAYAPPQVQSPPRKERARSNLPVPPTTLVGRESELAAISERLSSSNVRLLTLTGPPGVGKTRLGVEAAAGMSDRFEDGVFFVNLAPVTDPSLVPSTIRFVLDNREGSAPTAEQDLIDYLRDKQVLLVLDNFEHLPGSAPFVARLLEAAPSVKALVTSRAALGLRSEHVLSIQPLALPDPRGSGSVADLARYPSVQLLVDRARAALGDFALDDSNAAQLSAICTRLDGLPLAIELAAPRLRVLSPGALLSRLENRLRLLTGGAPDLSPRQQTLRATLAWSYELLSENERKLLRRLSVLVGGATLEAAEAVCNSPGDVDLDVLDGVSSLVNKSLLGVREGPGPREAPGGEGRFGMLETVREFAEQALRDSGEEGNVLESRDAYFTRVAELAEAHFEETGRITWVAHLVAEQDNFRAALGRLLARHDAQGAAKLAGALWPFWEVAGFWSEGKSWLQQVLAMRSSIPAPDLARVLAGAGALELYGNNLPSALALLEDSVGLWRELGDKRHLAAALRDFAIALRDEGSLDRAGQVCGESLELCRETGDMPGVAAGLYELGTLADGRGEIAGSIAFFEESLAIRRELDIKAGVASCLFRLGYAALNQGDYPRAEELLEESLAIRRELGLRHEVAQSISFLGRVARDRGHYEQARLLLEEGLALNRELGDRIAVAGSLNSIGEMLRLQGQYAAAVPYYEEGLTYCREAGFRQGIGVFLQRLGGATVQLGDVDKGAALLREALQVFDEMGSKRDAALCMVGLAAACAGSDPGKAARLLASAEATLKTLGASMPPADLASFRAAREQVRSLLSEAELDDAWAAGEAMAFEEAVAAAS